jgi:hypothetical protein
VALLIIGGLITNHVTQSARGALDGRWMLIYNTPTSVLQFNLDSIKQTAAGTQLWIRDDFIISNGSIVVTALTRVTINCERRTVTADEVIGYDAALNEILREPSDPSRVTPSTLAAFAFTCPHADAPVELLPQAPTVPEPTRSSPLRSA